MDSSLNTCTPADGIRRAAADLAAAQGAGALSVRAVGEAAGVAASAVLYHFGSRDGLLAAVAEALAARVAGWQAERLAAWAGMRGGLLSVPALLAATLCDRARRLDGALLALRELGRPADSADFWRALLAPWDPGEDDLALWTALADGIPTLAMLEDDPVARDALIGQLAQRTADRLAGRPVPPLPRTPPEPAPEPPRPEGRQRIVEAAVTLIGRGGLESLTHRAIAAEAGLSVAATTHFYAGKTDIVIDACRALQRRAVTAIAEDRPATPRFLSAIALAGDGALRPELAAMQAVTLGAARDPALRPVARTLRGLRGIDARRWLQARGLAEADDLDGLVWATLATALNLACLERPAGERRRFLDERSERFFALLFAG